MCEPHSSSPQPAPQASPALTVCAKAAYRRGFPGVLRLAAWPLRHAGRPDSGCATCSGCATFRAAGAGTYQTREALPKRWTLESLRCSQPGCRSYHGGAGRGGGGEGDQLAQAGQPASEAERLLMVSGHCFCTHSARAGDRGAARRGAAPAATPATRAAKRCCRFSAAPQRSTRSPQCSRPPCRLRSCPPRAAEARCLPQPCCVLHARADAAAAPLPPPAGAAGGRQCAA